MAGTLALPDRVAHWSMTGLREKLIKIGAKVVRHGRYVTFRRSEVAIPRIRQRMTRVRPVPMAFYDRSEYNALNAAGSIDTAYPLASTPVSTLVKEITARPDIRSFHLVKRAARS